ncbi:MAG: hypothetical protein Q4B48_08330 [Syntrophomonadaceae bacterium]|nr:hypothetical protein [Syntrophomonadaceae bacterium]
MKKKLLIITCIVAFLVIIDVAINIFAFLELREMTSLPQDPAGYDITVGNYSSGEKINLDDVSTKEKIVNGIRQIKYAGLYTGRSFGTPDDQAFYIIISFSSRDPNAVSHDVFEIAKSQTLSRAKGGVFDYSIKNYDDLYETVKDVFD